MNDQARIAQLRQELHLHNHYYYVENAPRISDREFDELMTELIRLEALHPELADPNSPSVRVGSDLSNAFTQVRHAHPMLSLGNTYNRQEVENFYKRIQSDLQGEDFLISCELKFDGLSISLIYEDGQLIRAVTRGDGVMGDDVTDNVRTIKSIPLQLQGTDYPRQLEIRGEILLPWQSFNALNAQRETQGEPLFANPRNAASGTLKNKNSKVVAERNLDAYLYYIPNGENISDSHYESLQKARSWGFKVSDDMRCVSTLDEVFSFIEHWDTEREMLPVATDGIVLKVDSLSQQKRLGNTSKSPRWAIAYKFAAERACTKLLEVTYQVGRTGAITPVANMAPVTLAGTVVKRASLHNENIIRQLDLHLGDMVYVEKAGEIIPQIVGVDTEHRAQKGAEAVRFITHCPDCGTKLVKYEDEAAYYCPNDSGCPTQLKGKIEHFISRDCMNIDSLGPETTDEYFQQGLIHTVADLYKIKVTDIAGADRSREVSARKIVTAIAKSREVGFERVLFALGIRFVGKVVARNIARHFRHIDALRTATLDQLLETEGVGKIIANSIISFFQNERNVELIENLKEAGLQFEIVETEKASDTLAGKSIVVSGTFTHHSREEYKALIEAHGGHNVGSISKKTAFLLAGENMGPAKLEKANSLNIRILSEKEFLEMIGEA